MSFYSERSIITDFSSCAEIYARPSSPPKPPGYTYPVNVTYMKEVYATYHWLWLMGKPKGKKNDFAFSDVKLESLRRKPVQRFKSPLLGG